MSLLLSLGSNIGDRVSYLKAATQHLEKLLGPSLRSQIYESEAVDYTQQDPFINQVLEFTTPKILPKELMSKILEIESLMGRKRDIDKGPRTIDIDILFWGEESINLPSLTIPHPRWSERSFITLPMADLPYGKKILHKFNNPQSDRGNAKVIPN